MCLGANYKKNIKKKEKNIFLIRKINEERSQIRSGSGSGIISQRYGSAPKCHGSPTLAGTRARRRCGPGCVAHQGEQDEDDVTHRKQGQLPVEGAPDR